MAIIALIGLLFRPLDPKALALLEASELQQRKEISKETNGFQNGKVASSPDLSTPIQQPKGKLEKARAMFRDYFKHFPVLFRNRKFMLFVLCYCMILCGNITIVITIDSFIGDELRGGLMASTITMIGFATGDLLSRLLSGALTAIPVFFPEMASVGKHTKTNTKIQEATTTQDIEENSQQSNFGRYAKTLLRGALRFLNARIIYVMSCWLMFLSMPLVVCLALFASRPPSVVLLFLVYSLVGAGLGGAVSQSRVVIVELVGLCRLAAAHSIFLLISAPLFTLMPFLAGVLKDVTGSWTLSFALLSAIALVFAVVNTFNLFAFPIHCKRTTQDRSSSIN